MTALTQKLENGCRILALTGITGIGKTALAERLVVEVSGNGVPFHRLNFDDRGQGRDFLSGALALLPKLGETVTTEDQKDPQNALKHLLQILRSTQFLIQIDSMEMLLQGDEQTGWNAFSDALWVDFFQQLLAGETCQSQLLLTSQALPEELEIVGSNYSRYWHDQNLGGLSEAEQLQLFEKQGLKPDEAKIETLKRIGALYEGHPLAIAVIARDILDKPFNGNVQQYWQRYQAEFDEIDRDRKKASSPRSLQLRVKQRVEQSLKRLPADAYQMLCRSSVYRRPVPEEFWLAMVELPEDGQWTALELLKSHNLAEQGLRTDGILLLRQHNLVRSVARRLLRTNEAEWRSAEQTAAQTWLNDYEPELDAPNLEQVRGNLEAFHHYCEANRWHDAYDLIANYLNTPTQEQLHNQLNTWSYYQEQINIYKKLENQLDKNSNKVILHNLGNAYLSIGNFDQALSFYLQRLKIAQQEEDLKSECTTFQNLGLVYKEIKEYDESIRCSQGYFILIE